jgi:glycosyltransferase involved in cell wall biosynthesis
VTTQPNRYSSFKVEAKEREDIGNMSIHRIDLPSHKSGMIDQVRSFRKFFIEALKITKGKQYDLVFASSSRLFTAYLGYIIARRKRIPLYLDIRDIFVDTMNKVMKNKLIKSLLIHFLKLIEKRTFNYASHINLISAGFKPYFSKFKSPSYSYYTNGIDNIFIGNISQPLRHNDGDFTITYAGNIGEGQGLIK